MSYNVVNFDVFVSPVFGLTFPWSIFMVTGYLICPITLEAIVTYSFKSDLNWFLLIRTSILPMIKNNILAITIKMIHILSVTNINF